MQITHNGKTYKIGKNSPWDLEDFLASNVMMWYLELVEGMYNCEHNKWTPYAHCDICWPHTIGWWNCKISVEETNLEDSFAEDFPNTWGMDKWVEEKIELLPEYWTQLNDKKREICLNKQVQFLTEVVNKLISFHNK